jgi:hypothetical protein
MPRNGSGVYSPPAANYPAVSGTLITASNRNAVDADLATALTGSIAVNGESVVTANIPMSGNKLTGLGAATARTDAASLANIQDGTGVYVGTVGGTADVITLTVSPAIASYVAGQSFAFIASGANTTNVTVNVSGLGAKAVTKNGSTALVAGDIASGALVTITYDGTRFQLIAVGNVVTFAGGTFTGDIVVPAEAYSVGWNGSNEAPTKNDVYDKIEAVVATIPTTPTDKIQPITASVAANALTITLNPTVLDFRSSTIGSGTVNTRTVSGAISVVVSSGSTLGTVNAVQSRIAVLAIDNAGTVEVACVNLAGGADLSETGLISTTAEGGAGAADSATVIYSTTARTSVPYRVVGYVESTQATAGTWATSPSTIQGAGGNAITAMSSLGYGQTWQDVTGSRTSGTTYYNTTGKPIMVSVEAIWAGASIVVGGVTINSPATTQSVGYSFIVPMNTSYVVTTTGIAIWAELR